jgi:hypothetical protein
MIEQRVGFTGTFAALALLISAGLAHAGLDFGERPDVKFDAPSTVIQEPVGITPKSPPVQTAAIHAGEQQYKAAKDEADEPRHRRRGHRAKWAHHADPIDVIAARAKIVRTKFRARLWRFTLHRRY